MKYQFTIRLEFEFLNLVIASSLVHFEQYINMFISF